MISVNKDYSYRATLNQLRGLVDLLIDLPMNMKRGLEIGSGTGSSAEILSCKFSEVFYTVDPIDCVPRINLNLTESK